MFARVSCASPRIHFTIESGMSRVSARTWSVEIPNTDVSGSMISLLLVARDLDLDGSSQLP
jgi:hypothetical protein